MVPVLMSGTLSMQGIIRSQGAWPWEWHAFTNPFALAAFGIFFISQLAEGNRTPFDLPEAESELVAGFATEYSGMRNLLFFMAEWGNLYVIGAIVTTLFLGGWHIPFQLGNPIAQHGLEFATFFLKAYGVGVLVPIWLRWTLPRIRVDQMMNMCWKYFLPISLASLILVSAWVWIAPEPMSGRNTAREIMRYAMFIVAGVGPLVFFVRRVLYTRKTTKVLDLRGA